MTISQSLRQGVGGISCDLTSVVFEMMMLRHITGKMIWIVREKLAQYFLFIGTLHIINLSPIPYTVLI